MAVMLGIGTAPNTNLDRYRKAKKDADLIDACLDHIDHEEDIYPLVVEERDNLRKQEREAYNALTPAERMLT